tara:strand:+ start:653 stop:1015 length:363 start_codon:yes stop_codon:yes gene_type:complete
MSGGGKQVADIIQERRGKKTHLCFQIVDGRSSPQMLTVKRIDRADVMLSYASFAAAELTDDESRIEGDFHSRMITVVGFSLAEVFEGLSDHRVTYLRELAEGHFAESDAGVITKIEIWTK